LRKNIISIIANGEVIKKEKVKNILSDSDIIIAADGGANNCNNLGIVPDYVIGDLDSVKKESIPSKSQIIIRKDQNYTDFQKSLKFAISLFPTKINVFSVIGKRTDHTIANLIILQKNKDIPIDIYDNYGKMQIFYPGKHQIIGEIGKTVSLFSLQPVKNLILSGFRYPVKNQNFQISFIGISNVYKSKSCSLEFDSGIIFLYEVF